MADEPLLAKIYKKLHGAADVPEITVEQLKELRDKKEPIVLLDVRETWEHEIARIEGSTLIPLGELPEKFSSLDAAKLIVVYCKMGGRSARAVKFLQKNGFKNAVNIAGGIDAWAERIDPSLASY